MYVVSHHCSDYNAVEISKFIKFCKKNNIPTIIDAASEEYMEYFRKPSPGWGDRSGRFSRERSSFAQLHLCCATQTFERRTVLSKSFGASCRGVCGGGALLQVLQVRQLYRSRVECTHLV